MEKQIYKIWLQAQFLDFEPGTYYIGSEVDSTVGSCLMLVKDKNKAVSVSWDDHISFMEWLDVPSVAYRG
jgi:hypothetical protein